MAEKVLDFGIPKYRKLTTEELEFLYGVLSKKMKNSKDELDYELAVDNYVNNHKAIIERGFFTKEVNIKPHEVLKINRFVSKDLFLDRFNRYCLAVMGPKDQDAIYTYIDTNLGKSTEYLDRNGKSNKDRVSKIIRKLVYEFGRTFYITDYNDLTGNHTYINKLNEMYDAISRDEPYDSPLFFIYIHQSYSIILAKSGFISNVVTVNDFLKIIDSANSDYNPFLINSSNISPRNKAGIDTLLRIREFTSFIPKKKLKYCGIYNIKSCCDSRTPYKLNGSINIDFDKDPLELDLTPYQRNLIIGFINKLNSQSDNSSLSLTEIKY